MGAKKKPDLRERLLEKGADSLSDSELLAILLRTGIKGKSVMQLAEEISMHADRHQAENIDRILYSIKGMGEGKITTILAAFELGRRYYGVGNQKIKHPSDIVLFLRHYATRKQEQFIVASLNGAHEIIAIRVVSVGILNRTIVHPREVFADPLSDRAASIIIAHNHPSGSLQPSEEDIAITERLYESGSLLGIQVLDHIILVPNGDYYSFVENKMFVAEKLLGEKKVL
ncbi:DNA repair protein RadC [Treponema phagedenis]|uniref:DNA repair protein RadC n=1 Tax=Treponema phagedenis TaxID=162 RepID=A0A0B7GW25_TREPH|nr:DNA repair protein RadC [Treponema phagedenis]EFW37190.1 DNA repair protein RadC [Treponema phagedenis F0421]NVP23213.1 DNA repair protein RadC [Treponema phagedenis]QEJ94799.1 DNA repair protein RadC [Treponema phagedenis]QEJ97982.1 DNA repair protein RadC [Treponema phagedenis]QEK00703.1 DNA repair protein RadC [Treponema phagedenis]